MPVLNHDQIVWGVAFVALALGVVTVSFLATFARRDGGVRTSRTPIEDSNMDTRAVGFRRKQALPAEPVSWRAVAAIEPETVPIPHRDWT